MTFQEWLVENPKVAALAPSALQFVQLGWMAAKLDDASVRLNDALEREAA